MSHYLAGGLMILLLAAATVLGMEAFGIYHAAQTVEAALLDAQLRLSADGGVSDEVRSLVERRIASQGGSPGRLSVSGSWPGEPYGQTVHLHVVYEHPYALNLLVPGRSGWNLGRFRIERTATTTSGWQP